MSEDNTARSKQIAAVELAISCYSMFDASLKRLNCDILSEDAVDNLRRLAGEMEQYIEMLDGSTYKLLD
jgi:hypothetical protein